MIWRGSIVDLSPTLFWISYLNIYVLNTFYIFIKQLKYILKKVTYSMSSIEVFQKAY